MPLLDPKFLQEQPSFTPPQQDPMAEEEPTPEEQALYDKFVTNAVRFISDPKNDRPIAKLLRQSSKPVPENIGRASAMVAQVLVQGAKAAGQELPPDVVFHGGQEIVEVMAEQAEAVGAYSPASEEEAEQTVQMAFLEAVKAYGENLLQTGGKSVKKLSAQAQDFWLRQVAREADSGQVDPALRSAAEQAGEQANPTPLAMAVKRGLQNG